MSFKSSVPSMLDGEKIGDTVVLELKKDIEKLSEESYSSTREQYEHC